MGGGGVATVRHGFRSGSRNALKVLESIGLASDLSYMVFDDSFWDDHINFRSHFGSSRSSDTVQGKILLGIANV